MSRPSRSSLHQEELTLKRAQGSLQSGMLGSNSEKWDRFCDDLGSSIEVKYSDGPNINLHGRTARECVVRLGNQVHPMIQTLFPNKNVVFQYDNVSIHTARSVQSWFEENEREFQHLPWPAQSPDLSTTEPQWSVLETGVRNTFLLPTSLKQVEDVSREECYKIPRETVQNL
jgi:hypothetical protein